MADKLRLGTEVRELKIGQSFTNNKAGAFHAVRYDFKPASVDINKIATVDIGASNQVTVNVPHLDGAGIPQTVFKGSHRPFTKECVLIFDRVTGEFTLEKLTSNMQVKKTRSETTKPILPQDRGDRSANNSTTTDRNPQRPATPPIGQRQSNKTRVTSGCRRPDRPITQLAAPKHSPLRASPNYSSPAHPTKSPKRPDDLLAPPASAGSLPLIGIDDFPDEAPSLPVPPPAVSAGGGGGGLPLLGRSAILSTQSDSEGVPEVSDSSSSSSSSDSDSGDEMDVVKRSANTAPPPLQAPPPPPATSNGTAKLPTTLPTTLLNDDLCLSESGSDDFDDD